MSTHVWHKDYIDSNPIPKVSRELLPWLIKDREEAVEGVDGTDHNGKPMHDGSGLKKAQQTVKQASKALAAETNPANIEFLNYQLAAAQTKVDFYAGKIYLLDKIITQAQKQ